MTASMSRKGNCWDNAPTESFFNSLKNERVHGTRYATRPEAEANLFKYIAIFYNRRRRHSTLGYSSPTQFLTDSRTGSASKISNPRRHKRGRLEDEKRRAPQFKAKVLADCDEPGASISGRAERQSRASVACRARRQVCGCGCHVAGDAQDVHSNAERPVDAQHRCFPATSTRGLTLQRPSHRSQNASMFNPSSAITL